jgi:hypothetical protein
MFFLLILAALAGPAGAATAEIPEPILQLRLIQDDRQHFHVEARATAPVPETIVWETIRDYDHLSEFIPMLVVSRRGVYQGRPVVEQLGRAKFLFLHFDARAVLEESFDPAAATLVIRAVDGDFARFESRWRLDRSRPGETGIFLSSEAVLKRWVPQWLERWQVRRSVDQSLRALLREMQRRGRETAKPV